MVQWFVPAADLHSTAHPIANDLIGGIIRPIVIGMRVGIELVGRVEACRVIIIVVKIMH